LDVDELQTEERYIWVLRYMPYTQQQQLQQVDDRQLGGGSKRSGGIGATWPSNQRFGLSLPQNEIFVE